MLLAGEYAALNQKVQDERIEAEEEAKK